MTGGPIAATIGACRCGAVRTAGHPRPRRPGAGSATDPAPPARRVGTSVPRSRPSSATAGSIGSAGRYAATRSGPAGRPRRPSPSRPLTPCDGRTRRRPTSMTIEPLFEGSSSSRYARRHDRLPARDGGVGAGEPSWSVPRPERPAIRSVPSTPRRRATATRPARPSRAGACGVRPTPDRRRPFSPETYNPAGRVPSLTSSITCWPSRRTSTLTVSPGENWARVASRGCSSSMTLPSTLVMMSPSLIPP